MAILSKDEFFESITNIIGTSTDDDAISFMENMSDTYNSLEEKANANGGDVEKRLKELDDSWREKYKKRFFSSKGGAFERFDEEDKTPEKQPEDITIDELFKKGN